MSTVIQDEINKLIRIETKDLSQSMAKIESGPLEDPRTWGDFAFDDLPPPTPSEPRGSTYASRGASGVGPNQATAVQRTGVHVAVGARPNSSPGAAPVPRGPGPGPAPAAGYGGSDHPVRRGPVAIGRPPSRRPNTPPRSQNRNVPAQNDEKRAKTVFYALFVVVGLVAAYVTYLLMSGARRELTRTLVWSRPTSYLWRMSGPAGADAQGLLRRGVARGFAAAR